MVAVIGDIHGCYFTLSELYNKIRYKYSEIPIYTVGDLVDRGNNSYETLEFIIKNDIKFTPGNHDFMFYNFFKDPSSLLAKTWVFNGNEATLESYETKKSAIDNHLDKIINAPLFYDLDDCFISHAGISENYFEELNRENFSSEALRHIVERNYKNDDGILWARGQLANIGKLQVVGHTKHKDVYYDEISNAVYIDTGACVGNKLTAVIIDKDYVIDKLEVGTHLNDLI